MTKRNKLKTKKTDSVTRLSLKEFKNTIKNGNEDFLKDKSLLIPKLFTPQVSIITDFTEEEKSIMKEAESDTMVEFIISTDSVDRDGDTIAVEGWKLGNFHRNPVVPWAHDYRQPPVARAINTRIEDNNLKSRAIFTGKELYPFGDMIGKMYKQKFLSAVSVGFNPSKWVFVDSEERGFGIDFLEQELMEYSAVPVPSNPDALIQARSKGIDILPMKSYLEELIDTKKTQDTEALEKLMKIFNSKTTTLGKTPDDIGDDLNEDGNDKIETQGSSDKDGDDIIIDDGNTNEDNVEDTSSTGTEEVEDYEVTNDTTLEVCVEYCKDLLTGKIKDDDTSEKLYKDLTVFLENKDIEIFDFKYVDSKVLKNFSDRFSFDDDTCLLTEKTQKQVEQDIVKENEDIIAKAMDAIKEIDPDYIYEEKEDLFLEIEEGLEEESDKGVAEDLEDDSDSENVITLEDVEDGEDLKSLLTNSIKTTFNSITGKLD